MEHNENAKILHLMCHQVPFCCDIRCNCFFESYGCGCGWAVPDSKQLKKILTEGPSHNVGDKPGFHRLTHLWTLTIFFPRALRCGGLSAIKASLFHQSLQAATIKGDSLRDLFGTNLRLSVGSPTIWATDLIVIHPQQFPVGQKRHLDVARHNLPQDNFYLSIVSQLPSPRWLF